LENFAESRQHVLLTITEGFNNLPTVEFDYTTNVVTLPNENMCALETEIGKGTYGTVYSVGGLPSDAPPTVVKWQIADGYDV